jgi:uncharacterized protein (TIGR00297 family)
MSSNFLIGFGLALVIALAAWRSRALSPNGAVTAVLLGAVIFGLGGLGWAVLLLAFFISSSVLSRLFRKRKRALDEKFSKGSQRDAGQVAANGGIAGIFVLFHTAFPANQWAWIGFAAALAAANADTWATEIGVLSHTSPRLITNGQVVERGTSGGVTLTGTLAALGGSALIALLAVIFWQGHILTLPTGSPDWLDTLVSSPAAALPCPQTLTWLGLITLAGLAGSLIDSFLGATLQAIYHCPVCQKETERHPLHSCGSLTYLIRGMRRLDNDWVNTLCTLTGALVGLAAYLVFSSIR